MARITSFGQVGATAVRAVSLTGADGLRLTVLALGARLSQLWVPDRAGVLADIVLGHDRLEEYQTHGRYVGATCGRFANRIAGARFVLDGAEVRLDPNEGATQLHGGPSGFDQAVWDIVDQSDRHVSFSHRSPAGDMGFPGTVEARCTYRLQGTRLLIEMTATTDAPTVVNLAHHSYFNLAGQGSGDVLGQSLQLSARHYLPVDAAKIPTGAVLPVAGSAFDFRTSRAIGATLPDATGFDHCFCLSDPLLPVDGALLRPCARASDPVSGRSLAIWTDQPGVQLYTGGHFDGTTAGKDGARYGRFAGFALETQGFPDSPNQPQFPSARLDKGQVYRHRMLIDLAPAG